MANLTYLKGVRTRYRNGLSNSIEEAKQMLDEEIEGVDLDNQITKVMKCLERIKLYQDKLEIQSEKLVSALDENDDSQVEIVDSDCELCSYAMESYFDLKEYKVKLEKEKQKLDVKSASAQSETNEILVQLQKDMQKLMATQLHEQQQELKHKQDVENEKKNSVKLPKLDMMSFSGDKTKWVEFWDSFESSVHCNTHISNVEKFNYLKSKLFGEARRAIAGLALSSGNYSVAIDILKDRFGNIQEIVDLHYNQLIHLFPATNTVASLRSYLDIVEKHLRCLEVMKQNIDQDVFVSMIRSKLPEEVLVQLEIQKGADTKWSVSKLSNRLREYVIARERAEKSNKTASLRQNYPKQSQGVFPKMNTFRKETVTGNRINSQNSTSAHALISANLKQSSEKRKKKPENYASKCRYCQQDHWSDECKNYKTLEERKHQLRGACYKCVKEGHKSQDCRANKKCAHCGKINSHHRSLCPEKFGNNQTSVHMSEEQAETNQPEASYEVTEEHALISSDEMVLMQTALVEIVNQHSSSFNGTKTRLLLDSGSQRTYITEKLANQLGLTGQKEQELKLVTFGSDKSKVIKTKSTELKLKLKNGTHKTITANIVPMISGAIQMTSISKTLASQLGDVIHSVELADTIPCERESSTIEMLIGNDYYLDIVLPNRIELQPGLYLLASILSGRTTDNSQKESELSMFVMTHGMDITRNNVFTSVDSSMQIEPNLQDFWNLESIGIKDKPEKSDDEKAFQIFKETLKFEEGRYQVTWPWRENEFNLPVNKHLAMGRLKSTVNRLCSKPELLEKYNNVINDQLQNGIIEKIENGNPDGILHYLPHQPVITPQKNTTKLRVVYDASAKSKKQNMSLNECLYRGPVFLQDLCGMLIRFRFNNVAIVADIEKAFLQIGLQKHQRDVTRFLWLKDCTIPNVDTPNVQEYRFCRVPFGIISSPFLLGATIQCHLESDDSDIADKMKNNIYVDNLITGTSNEYEGIQFYIGAKEIFRQASMNLREWTTNSEMLNSYIPDEDKAKGESSTVLGLCWNSKKDIISLKQVTNESEVVTKRNMLKIVASNFDPLGLFSPVLLNGKLLIQKLWSKRIEWDQEVPTELEEEWKEIKMDLQMISNVKIQRCVTSEIKTHNECYNLVCFCDASGKAYATTIYLQQTGNVSSAKLIFAKSRLAPLKDISIPRLELMGVLIGVRCLKFVQTHIKLEIGKNYLYTDSQCVLNWIKSEKELPVFVKNRVQEINKSDDIIFAYVKSSENPADIATRGASVNKLENNTLWWNGPRWLNDKDYEWPPESRNVTDETEVACEESPEMCHENYEQSPEIKDKHRAPLGIDCESYNSVTKLLRVTAYAIRFVRNLRNKDKVRKGPLTTEEIIDAERRWLICIQRKYFSEVIMDIQHNKRNTLQRQLGVFIDDNGLLRSKGRLHNADLTEGSRTPILLPKRDRFTHMIVEKNHKQLLHSGISQTLSNLRYRFWIPQGRSMIKSVLRKCRLCRRYEGGHYKIPMMPPLPKARVTESPPFSHTGLDYFGPLYIKSTDSKKKNMVTRAIHLELIQDMSSEEFLLCFKRFVSQRGVPVENISDNALQFKTSSRTLDLLWYKMVKCENIQNFTSEQRIKWKFIVELAPWMGGFYERLIGVVKKSLRKALGRRLLTLIQMQTVLKEIESVVNSRPLVYVGDDINSSLTLTPKHFLMLNSRISIPDMDEDEDEYKPIESSVDRLLKLWIKGQKLLTTFWRMWQEDYLLSLRERGQSALRAKKIESSIHPNIGDVVILKDNLPRCCWRLGRIIELHRSNDGKVRSAEVRLSTGSILRRPMNLLFPIESTESEPTTIKMPNKPIETVPIQRPLREAAVKAKQAIKEQC